MMQHVTLAICWICFGMLHSLGAAEPVKALFEDMMSGNYKYYRPLYSLAALIMVAFILFFNFTMDTVALWHPSVVEKTLAGTTGISGLIIMSICIYKYFFHLSGIDVFFKRKPEDSLKLDGLNKYVRHPLYSGTLLFAWSFFFWQPLLSNLISCFIITVYTVVGAYFEERKLVKTFGARYREYVSRVPMIIPRLF